METPTTKGEGREMRISIEEGIVNVVLSRRNLETLIAKLDGFPKGSACEIFCQANPRDPKREPLFYVKAEENALHYSGRPSPPGEMHPETEDRLKENLFF